FTVVRDAVTLPHTLGDANGISWTFSADGTAQLGAFFLAGAHQVPRLQIAAAGQEPVTFSNPTGVATADDGGRELLLAPAGLAGPGGVAPDSVTLAGDTLAVTWKNVHVAAGGSALIMHALSLQGDLSRAHATGERLTGMPPEMLEALAADEAQAIRNFAVP